MNKILKSGLLVVAIAAIAGTATWSYFSDQETVTKNTFATGTLDISVSPQVAAVKVENAAPGIWYPYNKKLTVMNNSSIDNKLHWKVSDQFVSQSVSGMYAKMHVSIWARGLGYDQDPKTAPDGSTIEAKEVYNGLLGDLDKQFRDMPKGWSASVWVFTKLDESADNTYQGANTEFNLVFDAIQQEDSF